MKLLLEKLLDILEAVLRFRHRRSSKTEKISVRVKNDPEKTETCRPHIAHGTGNKRGATHKVKVK